MAEKSVTLAVVNYKSVWGDKAANLNKMKSIVTRAAAEKNDIIVFPELALTGYDNDNELSMHHNNAEVIPGPATEDMAALAKKLNVYVIFGMPEQDKARPDIYYIAAALVGPEGVVGAYRKIHLASPPRFTETKEFVGGDQVPVFDTRFGKIGIQICRDFWFYSDLSKILALKGARIIINSCGSPAGPGKDAFIVGQTAGRATENTVVAASSNLVGKEFVTTFAGKSCIVGANPPRLVQVLAEGGDGEEVVSATINLERLDAYRAGGDWARDRRGDVIAREMQAFAAKK